MRKLKDYALLTSAVLGLVVALSAPLWAQSAGQDPMTAGWASYSDPFVAPAGGSATAPTFSGSVSGGNFIINPATGYLEWSGITRLYSPTDGVLRVAKNANGNPTSLVSGIILGPVSSAGQSLVYDSAFGWRSMTGDQGLNSGFAGLGFTAIASNTFYGTNSGTTCGMNVASSSTMDLRANSIVGLALSSTAQASQLKWTQSAQPSGPVGVTAAQSYTIFTNRGAAGSVTFNVPAPTTAGLEYTFRVIAAQTIVVTAASGNISTIGGLTGATRTLAATAGTTITIVSDGTDYLITASLGTIT